ncbi:MULTISPECIES: NIPSNAP family protein [unclassified Pseudomonas]|uniref:NIPSNAP family protein n=1 Tax=unclassified Pseudomonas TaxID=196821 RepID=UPI0025EE1F35|nr:MULTISPECIES: NIPSNAP family protein [unclassified Pseudomonas]
MQYELRYYHVEPGRMHDLDARMRDGLPPLLHKHGIRVVGRWHAIAGRGTPLFIYLMAWKDNTERETHWNGFYADPDWWALRAETNGGSELVQHYDISLLTPSPAWLEHRQHGPAPQVGALHELIVQPIANGQPKAAHAYLAQTALPVLNELGASLLGSFNLVAGQYMPGLVSLLSWPDFATREAGWQAYWSDARIQQAHAEQRRSLGRSLLGRADTWLLRPTPYADVDPSLGLSQ